MSAPPETDRSLGEIVSDASEKASLLVREEIELAKAEVKAKVKTLGKGAAVGTAAGVFLVFAVVMFLFFLAFFFNDLFNVTSEIWLGFLIVFLILVALAVIAGLLARKWLSSGPPTPDMAIEQAKATRDELEHPGVERHKLPEGTR